MLLYKAEEGNNDNPTQWVGGFTFFSQTLHGAVMYGFLLYTEKESFSVSEYNIGDSVNAIFNETPSIFSPLTKDWVDGKGTSSPVPLSQVPVLPLSGQVAIVSLPHEQWKPVKLAFYNGNRLLSLKKEDGERVLFAEAVGYCLYYINHMFQVSRGEYSCVSWLCDTVAYAERNNYSPYWTQYKKCLAEMEVTHLQFMEKVGKVAVAMENSTSALVVDMCNGLAKIYSHAIASMYTVYDLWTERPPTFSEREALVNMLLEIGDSTFSDCDKLISDIIMRKEILFSAIATQVA